MTMVANNYLNDGIPNTKVIELMTLGFTGKLLDWWNNCLTKESKEDIKLSKKMRMRTPSLTNA